MSESLGDPYLSCVNEGEVIIHKSLICFPATIVDNPLPLPIVKKRLACCQTLNNQPVLSMLEYPLKASHIGHFGRQALHGKEYFELQLKGGTIKRHDRNVIWLVKENDLISKCCQTVCNDSE